MKKVLLMGHHDAYARHMARWARILKRQGEWEPIVYIAAEYMDRHMDACRAEGITVLPPTLQPEAVQVEAVHADGVRPTAQQRLKAVLYQVPGLRTCLRTLINGCRQLVSPFRVFSEMAGLTKQIRFVRHVIRQQQIGVLMISESSPAYGAPVYIRAAHQEGVPVVTVPLEKATAHHYAENYLTASYLSLKRPLNRLIGVLYPRWVIAHKGRRMVRVTPELLLALEWLQLGPPHPWQLVGNLEDAIAVDSQDAFDHYVAEGVAPQLMIVTGTAEHDILSEVRQDTKRLKAELYDRLGLPAGRPMLLSALVQAHYVTGRPECDFQEYEKMVEFWVKSLAATEGYNIVINLHPGHSYRQDSHTWDYIEQWGVKICRQDVATLIPLCDIYVAAGSSTIPWAIACGKPVINYDVYRYGTPIYRSALGVLTMQEQQEFVAVLKRLTSDPAYYAEIAARQAACAEQWGKLDGKAGERLVRLFDRLLENYQKS